LAYAGVLAVVAAAVLLLVEAGVTPWLAALVIGVLVLILGGALVMAGRSTIAATDLTPRRTIETIRDDATMAKEQLK
jgi:phosphatidylglycerophosphate synthase